jgi:3-dehydroquinate dehydratase I
MVCVCLAEPDSAVCIELMKKEKLIEIRLDMVDYTLDEISRVFAVPGILKVATCRPAKLTSYERLDKLKAAIAAGANYVDIEIESEPRYRETLSEFAKANNCKVIISFHDYDKTPGLYDLLKVVEKAEYWKADVVKVACMVHDTRDAARLLALYNSTRIKVISFGMGEKGKFSRLASLMLGAEFTYAAAEKSEGTAPGQLTRKQFEQAFDALKKSGVTL